MNAPSPAIHIRDRRFSREALAQRWWIVGDPVGTAFFNALSAGFPKGEAFFVETVRIYRDGAPPQLAEEISGFSRQEILHTREHVAFNRRCVEAGYDMSSIENAVDRRLRSIRARGPLACITATMALEHFTAMIADAVLVDPSHLEKAEPGEAALWRWHAIDEIEHKGVAFDTWMFATRHWSPFKRWKAKTKAMLLCTRNLVVDRYNGSIELLRQDGITGLRARLKLFWYVFGYPGLLRKILPAWLGFFLPGFHPWNHDNRALIADTRRSLGDHSGAMSPAA
jgi:uncharacterized protein